jgi:membrane protein YqaA with SNARE-associated domain
LIPWPGARLWAVHIVAVLGKALKVFGVILLLFVAFIACYLLKPGPPGGWLQPGALHGLAVDIWIFIATLGLIGLAAVYIGFRVERKGTPLGMGSAKSDRRQSEK